MRKMINNFSSLYYEYQASTRLPLKKKVVAEKMGISRPTLDRWLDGDVRRFDEETLAGICNFFDCELEDLMRLEPKE